MPKNIDNLSQPLRTSVKLAYAGPAFVLSLLGIIFYAYLPKFYAESYGLNLAVIGYIILACRAFEAVSAPIIGYLSDRIKEGRRKSFMRLSFLPLAGSFYCLLNPLSFLPLEAVMIWFATFSFLFFLFLVLLAIPYEALGPELASDYDERTRLFTFREGAIILGALFAILLPEALKTASSDQKTVFQAIGIIYGLLLVAAVTNCLKWVPEKKLPEHKIPANPFFSGIREIMLNKNFFVLLSAYMVSVFGASLPATLIFFFVQDVLGSRLGGAYLLLYFVVGFMFVPVWGKLAIMFGKKKVWIWSMLISSGAFMFMLILKQGDESVYALLVAVSAIGLGGTQLIPPSMQADIIDTDEKKYGSRREGQFAGLWTITKKSAAAISTGLAFPILAYYGYKINLSIGATTVVNSPQALQMLSFLYAGVPCLCNFISILILSRYNDSKS